MFRAQGVPMNAELPKVLKDGYRRFLRENHAPERGRYMQLAELGQAPTAMVVGCCDARIDIAAIFDTQPGELFIVRNVANLVPPYEPTGKFHGTSAALEFAVQELRVPNVIVLGHSHCGGIDAYRQKPRPKSFDYSFVGNWLTLLDGLKLVESDRFTYGEETAFELAGVRSSLAKLRTFPFIERPLADGLLQLHGLHFDLGSGTLLMLDEETGKFVNLNED
jgi:carbonic anhydrase